MADAAPPRNALWPTSSLTTRPPSTTGIATALPAAEDEPHRRRARLTWAALIKKVYEVDPLLCPFCGAEMKIIAFITEHSSVRSILRHLGMPAQRPEPLAHSPPAEPLAHSPPAEPDILEFELLEIA